MRILTEGEGQRLVALINEIIEGAYNVTVNLELPPCAGEDDGEALCVMIHTTVNGGIGIYLRPPESEGRIVPDRVPMPVMTEKGMGR